MNIITEWAANDPLFAGLMSFCLVMLILWLGQQAWRKLSPTEENTSLWVEIVRVRSRLSAVPSMDSHPEAQNAIEWAERYYAQGRLENAARELATAKTHLRRFDRLIA